jgi:hypothetical protein
LALNQLQINDDRIGALAGCRMKGELLLVIGESFGYLAIAEMEGSSCTPQILVVRAELPGLIEQVFGVV